MDVVWPFTFPLTHSVVLSLYPSAVDSLRSVKTQHCFFASSLPVLDQLDLPLVHKTLMSLGGKCSVKSNMVLETYHPHVGE